MVDRVSVYQGDENQWWLEFYNDDVRYGILVADILELLGRIKELELVCEDMYDYIDNPGYGESPPPSELEDKIREINRTKTGVLYEHYQKTR